MAGESETAAGPPPEQATLAAPLGDGVGGSIGPYKLLSVIGEGGFGIVYLAQRREPYVQRVALKVIKPGMDSRAVVARFEQERQALAVMDHPNVAKVLDGGLTEQGRPYFVMEHVQGEPITEYCDRHTLSIKERLELFVPVCEAVQHAHMKGIIHRDLKPSNILVSVQDRAAIPKVIDFGIAKAISHTLTDKTIFTEQGQLIGTPEYMSPEQAEMGATDIDTRTDIYSLGVVLYELLTGLLPFDPQELRSKGYGEVQRLIREVDPPTPSRRLSTASPEQSGSLARHRHSRPEELARVLRRELEWIPLRCLRKDRLRRYQTCRDVASDVRRYLAGAALEAAPESRLYRTRKLLSSNRGVVAAVMVMFALAVSAIGIGLGLSGRYANETNAWHYLVADLDRAVGRQLGRFGHVPADLPRTPEGMIEHPWIKAAGAQLQDLEPELASASSQELLWELLVPADLAARRAIKRVHPAYFKNDRELGAILAMTGPEKLAQLRAASGTPALVEQVSHIPERLEQAARRRSAAARGVKIWTGTYRYDSDLVHVPTNLAQGLADKELEYLVGGFDLDTGHPLGLGRLAELRGRAELHAYPRPSARFRTRYAARLWLPAAAMILASLFAVSQRVLLGEAAAIALALALCLVSRTVAGIYVWHFELADALLWSGALVATIAAAACVGLQRKRWMALVAAALVVGVGAAMVRLAVDQSGLPRSVKRLTHRI